MDPDPGGQKVSDPLDPYLQFTGRNIDNVDNGNPTVQIRTGMQRPVFLHSVDANSSFYRESFLNNIYLNIKFGRK